MADRWYYGWDDQKLGPFSARELRELADNGKIQPMDTVWKEGVATGVLAHEVKNLFEPLPEEEPLTPADTIIPPRAMAETEIVINITSPPPAEKSR